MIKLKYNQFMGFPFSQSMQKLTSSAFPVKIAYSIKKIADGLQKQREKISAEFLVMVAPFTVKNPDGTTFRPKAEDSNGFEIAEDQKEAFKQAEKAFGETEFTLDRPRLCLSELGEIQFSAAELAQLDALIAGEPDASTGQIATVTQLPTAAVAPAETTEGVIA